jgi:flagella synthesis protein FlgN
MHSSDTSPANSLNEEHKATRYLIQLLKQEQAQLIEADIEGLIALTEEKSKVVAQITELTKLRYQALAAAGFAPREAGMKAWLKDSAATATANKSWTELLELARAAKELNRTNGLLINKHMLRNQTALNVLRGNAQDSNFYGPDGQSTAPTGTRNLVIG